MNNKNYIVSKVSILIIISIFSIILFFISFPTQALEEKNIPLQLCESIEDTNPYLRKMREPLGNQLFIERYEEMKSEYHNTIEQIFTDNFQKTFGETNINDIPENVCRPFLYKEQTQTQTIDFKLNTQHTYYKCTLLKLAKYPQTQQNQSLLSGINHLNNQAYKYQKEIQDSFVAKEITLQSYEEMRMWYPVHRDLLCLIRELTTYNTQVRNFTDRIVIMPKKFLNYGSHTAY